jgi:hypothetical protein
MQLCHLANDKSTQMQQNQQNLCMLIIQRVDFMHLHFRHNLRKMLTNLRKINLRKMLTNLRKINLRKMLTNLRKINLRKMLTNGRNFTRKKVFSAPFKCGHN